MFCKVSIDQLTTVNEIKGYWTTDDYINLLQLYNFPADQDTKIEDLPELLKMAITDFEPNEAAEIALKYKLSESLNDGQIENIAHEMLQDKISEEYPNISLHYPMFNINQLLFKAYNGKFPNTQASIIDVEFDFSDHTVEVNGEMVLKALSNGLSDRCLIHRLFEDQLKGEKEFIDADNIIWEIRDLGNKKYQIITSEYWISKDDFTTGEFKSDIHLWEAEEVA